MSLINLRDPESVGRALLPWLHERLPQADTIELPPPRKPANGGSSENFFIDPVIREKGTERRERWVLRIEAIGYQVYKDPSVERQFRVMQILADNGQVPTPKPLWYEPDNRTLGAPFFIMERVEGEPIPRPYHSHGLLADSSPSAREAIWLSAIDALARVHKTNDPRLEFLARPELGLTGLDQEIAYWTGYMHWSEIRVRRAQEIALRWLVDNAPAERGTGLAWGDAQPTNMIFRDNACTAVIDWETVSLGGAETDLGWWLFCDWQAFECLGIPRLEGFAGKAETIIAWEQFSGRKAQSLEWHEVFATWRFGMIVDRARLLAERIGRPDAVPAEIGVVITERLAKLIAG